MTKGRTVYGISMHVLVEWQHSQVPGTPGKQLLVAAQAIIAAKIMHVSRLLYGFITSK